MSDDKSCAVEKGDRESLAGKGQAGNTWDWSRDLKEVRDVCSLEEEGYKVTGRENCKCKDPSVYVAFFFFFKNNQEASKQEGKWEFGLRLGK